MTKRREREELEARLGAFGHHLGLVCKIPSQEELVGTIYCLYASQPDKIESAIKNDRAEFINFGDNIEEALKMKRDLRTQGCHVFLAHAKADAGGKMIPSYYNNVGNFVEAVLHEGFHNNPCNEMHKMIEEPAAYLMGIEGAVAFFSIWGGKENLQRAIERRKNFDSSAGDFIKRYQTRIAKLKAGVVISPDCPNNNAKFLLDSHCFLYYPLIQGAHQSIGFLGQTRYLLTGLSPDLEEGIRKLKESIAG